MPQQFSSASNDLADDSNEQINKAVADMDKITHQNAAGAEESSSASETMNMQASEMKTVVKELDVLVNGGKVNTKKQQQTASRAPAVKHNSDDALTIINPKQLILQDDDDFKSF